MLEYSIIFYLIYCKKSHNFVKNTYSKLSKSDLFKALIYVAKKHLKRCFFNKWCAILYSYRTDEYEDFKQLCYKIEMF